MKKKLLLGCVLILCCSCTLALSGVVLVAANFGTILESIPERYGVEQDTSRFVKIKDVINKETELNAAIEAKLDELVEKSKNNEPLVISFTEEELMAQYLQYSEYKNMAGLGIDITDNKLEMIFPFQDLKSFLSGKAATNPVLNYIFEHSSKLYLIVSLTTKNGKVVGDDVTLGSPSLDRALSENLKDEIRDYLTQSFDSSFQGDDVVKLEKIEFKDNQMFVTYKLV